MNINVQFYETIARFYDAENLDLTEDLELYNELADETGDPIFDVGCGSGRVLLHLAKNGHRIVGLDRSKVMLTRGQQKLDRMPDAKRLVTFVHGDALQAELSYRFKLIIVSYNSFMHFSELADQLMALRRFQAMLDDDGLLVMDLPNAGEAFGAQDYGAMVLERTFIEPETGHMVMQQSVSSIDRATQHLHITWIYDEIMDNGAVHRTLAPLRLRYVFAGEMDLLLEAAGLHCVELYGDYQRIPFEDGSPRMIVLAQKA
jgi:ubiquinone/menaquinone biosynthesis C-methylase UbiE